MSSMLINYFMDEGELVSISRVCTDNEDKPGNVAKNITSLVEQEHWSVFDHAFMSFNIEAPIYVMRQWMRHKGAWMEKSRRYTKDEPQFGEYFESHEYAETSYKWYLDVGVKPEDARKVLPLDLMTKCVWTASLRTIFHFLRLRLDGHAQKEIQEEAKLIAIQVARIYPNAFQAWVKYDFLAYSVPDGENVTEVRRGQAKVGYRRRAIEEIMDRVKNLYPDS